MKEEELEGRMTFLTLWSLSIVPPKEDKPFENFSKLCNHIINGFIFIHTKNFILRTQKIYFSPFYLRGSLMSNNKMTSNIISGSIINDYKYHHH